MFQKKTKKSIFVCLSGIPHPTLGASSVLFYYYIEELKKSGHKILLVLLLQKDAYSEKVLMEYIEKNASPYFEVLPSVSESFLDLKRYSINLNLETYKAVFARIQEFNPDAAVLFDFLSTWLNEAINIKKIVWLGDLNFHTTWYHAWYGVMENPSMVKFLPFAWWRAYLWRGIYRSVLSKVDSVIVSSKSSEWHLKRLGISSVYHAYPWPDTSSDYRTTGKTKRSKPSFLFLGNLVGLGSRSALHFIVKKLYPSLVRTWGENGFEIFISGSYDLPPWFSLSIQDKPEFNYVGFVEDLSELMFSCHAVIAPIDVPVGNRSRVVTAMANKALVIAHKNTALGNPDLVNDVTCWLANDADQFVAYMKKSVEQPQVVIPIVSRARQVYENKFRPEKSAGLLIKELARVIDQKDNKPTFEK